MAIEHVNRRGDKYTLQLGKSRSGKPNYYFGRKVTGTPVDTVPEGFEIHEDPQGGQVFLRKAKPSPITPDERRLLETALRVSASVRCLVDVQDRYLTVWAADTGERDREGLFAELSKFGIPSSILRGALESHGNYGKVLRFSLVDEDRRLFLVERWCFRGEIDGWMHIFQPPAPLEILIRKYAPHLGQESFFDLA